MTPLATPAVVPERDGENTALASAVTSTVSVSVASCIVTGDFRRLAERHDHAGERLRPEAAHRDLQVVGPDLQVQQIEPPVGPRERLVASAGRDVHGDHARARQYPLLRVADDAAERPRGGVLRLDAGDGPRQRGGRDHRNRDPLCKTIHLDHLREAGV